MSPLSLPRRSLFRHARPQHFTARTPALLGLSGFSPLSPEPFPQLHRCRLARPRTPDLLIVDERRLDEARGTVAGECPPIILLTGRQGAPQPPAEVVGIVKRPAGLHDLYRLLQQVFEDTPRGVPRVPTLIRAHCRRGAEEWDGALLTLSENGALLRSETAPPLGSRFELSFDLPASGPLALEGEAAY